MNEHFLPVKVHIKEQPQTFERFGVQWTPTLVLLDSNGSERHRFEGYLPPDDFLVQLRLGLAHAERARGEWSRAATLYAELAEDPKAGEVAPEALYWAGVSRYKGGDQSALPETARLFQQRFPDSNWAKKASVWAG